MGRKRAVVFLVAGDIVSALAIATLVSVESWDLEEIPSPRPSGWRSLQGWDGVQ